MRKVVSKEKRQQYIEKFNKWFQLVYEDNDCIRWVDQVGNEIYHSKTARTKLVFFLQKTNFPFTFTGAIRSFEKYGIVKIES